MKTSVVYVGMDVHKESITFAMLIDGSEIPVIEKLPNQDEKIRRFFKKASKHGKVKTCYEASSCGYVLWRKLNKWGFDCDVIAPSLVPKGPGDRIKTDTRDAKALVKLLRADMLVKVAIPTEKQEMDRSLVRLRKQKSEDVKKNKHRVLKFLTARGFTYSGKNFSPAFRVWIKSLPLPDEDRFVINEFMASFEYEESRLCEVNRKILELAETDEYKDKANAFRSLKGIDTLSAMVILTEVGDFTRFNSATQFMAYVGLTPSESSSGQTRIQGRTGNGGNKHVRFILVEAAWHYRHRPSIGKALAKRQEGQPSEVVSYAMKAQQRLYKKYWKVSSIKSSQKAAVAVARELSGFVWGIATNSVS
jgi:transposase